MIGVVDEAVRRPVGRLWAANTATSTWTRWRGRIPISPTHHVQSRSRLLSRTGDAENGMVEERGIGSLPMRASRRAVPLTTPRSFHSRALGLAVGSTASISTIGQCGDSRYGGRIVAAEMGTLMWRIHECRARRFEYCAKGRADRRGQQGMTMR